MVSWFLHLDRLLRGDTTRPDALRNGTLQINAGGLAVLIVLLGAIYGLCMGSYSLLKEVNPSVVDPDGRYMQLLATSIKVPALFYLTLLVTFPSLYVFNALVGSRLTVMSVLRLLIASLAVNLAVLSSLGPIVLFFSLTTKSYSFVLLLNVVMYSIAGVLGLGFLRQTLHRLTTIEAVPAPQLERTPVTVDEAGAIHLPESVDTGLIDPSAIDMPPGQNFGRHTRLVFTCWMIVFALVGAQMGWVLRPFVGNPNLPFSWFRERGSNFFEAVLNTIGALLSGG
jgi:hypothetical protein